MSRASMVDLPPEEEQAVSVESEDQEIQQLPLDTTVTDEVEQPQEPQVPEKYSGKSLEQVVQMHQEAEKLLGRQSTEVGDLRKVVDDYITNQTQQPAPQQEVGPEDELDYFTDPEGAVNRAINNHPKIREAEEYTARFKKQTSLAELQSKHPDMKEILKDENFIAWKDGSPIRKQLFAEADKNYNVEAGNELFTTWKGLTNAGKENAQQAASLEIQNRKQQIKSANTGSAQGSAEKPLKKTYRRTDIIKLMRTDPDRYQALQEEIYRAYQEGRVK
jgi:uncharacterized phage-associated protein|tara:strand:+ start:633 stop:1457 length:825 start_codon:yes stop_codon:yes gene_type:complete